MPTSTGDQTRDALNLEALNRARLDVLTIGNIASTARNYARAAYDHRIAGRFPESRLAAMKAKSLLEEIEKAVSRARFEFNDAEDIARGVTR